jgi:hypothetical protein
LTYSDRIETAKAWIKDIVADGGYRQDHLALIVEVLENALKDEQEKQTLKGGCDYFEYQHKDFGKQKEWRVSVLKDHFYKLMDLASQTATSPKE